MQRTMIEHAVPDYIHDYIEIDDADLRHLQNSFATSQLTRLRKIAHLGLIGRLRPLARHDKLEHAYGTYWLCRQCTDHTHGLIDNKKAFRLAGLMHGIGHLPFSYGTEYAVARLCHYHPSSRDWLASLLEECVSFAGKPAVEAAASHMNETVNCVMLHRWIGALKMARSSTNEFSNDLGREIVRILVDTEMLEHQLLFQLDRVDYVLRDWLYLALGRIDVNISPLLAQFKKSATGGLVSPKLLELIETAYDSLCEQIYLGDEERCLAQVFEKSVATQIVEGRLQPEQLLDEDDDSFEEKLRQLEPEELDLAAVVRRIKDRKLVQVSRITCDPGGVSVVELEANLAGTNKTGVHKYHRSRGVYVECIPNPYHGKPEAYEWTKTGASVGIMYDFDSVCPHHVIGSLLRVERWTPENRYGTQLSCREDALGFLLGLQVTPQFGRYYEDVRDLIMKQMPKPRDEWQRELFRDSWPPRDWAVFEALFYEYDDYWSARHFLRFPEHWSTKIIEDVLTLVNRSRGRRRPREDVSVYNERAQRLAEYSTYLQTILDLRRCSLSGWVVPSVMLHTGDGTLYTEIDVISLYVQRAHDSPVIIDLSEVSLNDSTTNQEDARRKLEKVIQCVRTRFPRNVCVGGYFNGRSIVSWPSAGRKKYKAIMGRGQ